MAVVSGGWSGIRKVATIRDVAREAGVSVATVSYVLNNKNNVSSDTAKRVVAAARRLSYTPSAAARSLAAGYSNLVALVVPDLRNPFFPEVAAAFQEAANAAGMEALVLNATYDVRRMREFIQRLIRLQVPGAAFLISRVEPALRAALADNEINAVYQDYDGAGPGVASVSIAYAEGMVAALNHLLELGHRRIAYIGGPLDGPSAQLRRNALLAAGPQETGVEIRTAASDWSVQGGYFAFSKLLNDFNATAVIAANDQMAIGAMHCAYDRRISVPRELSVIGFDDITYAQFTQPALTTVSVPRSRMGELAFKALHDLCSKPDEPGAHFEVETTLAVRGSTAEARSD